MLISSYRAEAILAASKASVAPPARPANAAAKSSGAGGGRKRRSEVEPEKSEGSDEEFDSLLPEVCFLFLFL